MLTVDGLNAPQRIDVELEEWCEVSSLYFSEDGGSQNYFKDNPSVYCVSAKFSVAPAAIITAKMVNNTCVLSVNKSCDKVNATVNNNNGQPHLGYPIKTSVPGSSISNLDIKCPSKIIPYNFDGWDISFNDNSPVNDLEQPFIKIYTIYWF